MNGFLILHGLGYDSSKEGADRWVRSDDEILINAEDVSFVKVKWAQDHWQGAPSEKHLGRWVYRIVGSTVRMRNSPAEFDVAEKVPDIREMMRALWTEVREG